MKCDCNNHCEININTRRTCSSCRLAKCFSSGMDAQMIRPSRTKPINRIPKQTTVARLSEGNQVNIRNLINIVTLKDFQ